MRAPWSCMPTKERRSLDSPGVDSQLTLPLIPFCGVFLRLEWTIPGTSDDRPGNGLLAMEFLPRAIIGFAALSEPYRQGVDRHTVHGKLPAAEALEAVRAFTDRIQRKTA